MKYIVSDFKIQLEKWRGSLKTHLEKEFHLSANILNSITIIKKSIDARDKKNIKFVFSFTIDLTQKQKNLFHGSRKLQPVEDPPTQVGVEATIKATIRPVVIGFGPAGIFATLYLVKSGLKPMLIEKGEKIELRTKKVNKFWEKGVLDEKCNVQFGEGGAGTFSDGKLTTQKNNPYINFIKQTLVDFGAPKEILYLAKPHLGTDNLKNIILNIRKYFEKEGVEIKYESELTDFVFKNNELKSIIINHQEEIMVSHLILACGHSARTIFKNLLNKKVKLSFKPFACGIRIEHPQDFIDLSQYGKKNKYLPPADYKLTFKSTLGHSVYSFCMCPGGRIIPATSDQGQVVTNGMSYFKRNEYFGNSAIVVSITEKDVQSQDERDELKGLTFQKLIEEKAYLIAGKNYNAPAQRVTSFLSNKIDSSPLKTSYRPGITNCNLKQLFPSLITDSLTEALTSFDQKIKGFISDEAVLVGPETRTSSPIRILRDKNHESISHKGIFPCGEGSGYSGGIISSALDGLLTAMKLK